MLFISARLHGVFDYLLALMLVVSPWVFGMSDTLAQAMSLVGAGCFVLMMNLMTNYDLGAVKIIPLSVHIALDVLVGVFLVVSPWLFNFDAVPHALHLFSGLSLFVVAAFTVRLPKNARSKGNTQYVQWV